MSGKQSILVRVSKLLVTDFIKFQIQRFPSLKVAVQGQLRHLRGLQLPLTCIRFTTVMRAAEAAGAETPLQFARPLGGKVHTAAEWAAVFVRHVEHGSHELSNCVSFTAGSSTNDCREAR